MLNEKQLKSKRDLLMAYGQYAAYVRKFDDVLHNVPKEVFANAKFREEFGCDIVQLKMFPWVFSQANSGEKEDFENLLQNENPQNYDDCCYVSLNQITTGGGRKGDFVAVPYGMGYKAEFFSFPNPVERYSSLYFSKTLLKDTKFIIDGDIRCVYTPECGEMTLGEAFETPDFRIKFASMLNIVSGGIDFENENQDITKIVTESLASDYLKPMEATIVKVMARMAEAGRDFLQENYKQEDVFGSAEKNGMIASAERFKDYINIRNLLHHQNDSLTQFGYFFPSQTNAERREAYLASYRRVYGKNLFGRAQSYITVLKDFRGLLQKIYPNFLSRQEQESNSKFVARLKDYARKNPEQKLVVELNYPYKNDKSEQLLKNVMKLFPEALVVDNPKVKYADLQEELSGYNNLDAFLQASQGLEGYMSFYCLTHGKNLTAMKAVNFLKAKNVIDETTAEKLKNFRDLRNRLSHQFFTTELAETLQSNMPDFQNLVVQVGQNIRANMPKIKNPEGNIFYFTHADGKVVGVDFGDRRIISVKYPEKIEEKIPETQGLKGKVQKLTDGTIIDAEKQKVVLGNKAVLYYNSDKHYSLILQDSQGKDVKFLMDKNFVVKTYVNNGKSIGVSRGDMIKIGAFMVALDSRGRLARYSYKNENQAKQSVLFDSFQKTITTEGGLVLGLKDNTCSLLADLKKTKENVGR